MSSDTFVAAHSKDLLLAEFQAIQQRVIQIEQSRSTSTNLYLIIVAGTLAGLSSLVDKPPTGAQPTLLLIALTVILVTGMITYEHAINQSVITTILLRRAGRIRRWFAIQDPQVRVFLPFEYTDDKPNIPFLTANMRGSKTFAFAINIIIAGLITALLFISISVSLAVFGAAGTGIATWALQKSYAVRKIRDAHIEISKYILFPSEINHTKP